MIKRKDIKYRVNTFKDLPKKTFATFLVYIDARTAMDELDGKYGEGNWEFNWRKVPDEKWAVRGRLKVYTKDRSLVRHDVGYPADNKTYKSSDGSQWLKDAISDALKRCAVQFGIGRELYDAPFLYTEEVKVYTDAKGKARYKGLTSMGEQLIEGTITKWYDKLKKQKAQ